MQFFVYKVNRLLQSDFIYLSKFSSYIVIRLKLFIGISEKMIVSVFLSLLIDGIIKR